MSKKIFSMNADSRGIYQILNHLDEQLPEYKIKNCLANQELQKNLHRLTNKKLSIQEIFFSFDSKEILENKRSIIKFLPLERLISVEEKYKIQEILNEFIDKGEYTNGGFLSEFERHLEEFLDINHVVSISSGTDALIIALLTLGVKYGDEVIMPANSFSATENAVLAVGAKPILVDINADTFNIDVMKIEEKISKHTRVILPVHLYGKLADVKAIREIANAYGLFVLEDACQAIGVSDVGLFSDIAALSFNPYKNFGVCGKAGALITNNDELASKAKRFSYHGFSLGNKNIKEEIFGLNARMDNGLAAIGLVRLPYLSHYNFKRAYLAKMYIKKLQTLAEKEKIILPEFGDDSSWHLFTIKILQENRNIIRRKLLEKYGIETDIYYPVLTHRQKNDLKKSIFKHVILEKTEQVNSILLNLPLFNGMEIHELDKIVECLYGALR